MAPIRIRPSGIKSPRTRCTALLSDLDHPDKMAPEILDKLADHLIQKALKEKGLRSDAQAVADIGRRLEAGETVTLDAFVADVVEQEPGK